MSFMETVNSMKSDAIDCIMIMEKCNIFTNSCFREFDINCQEAELKVIKESGTSEDYAYLVEAATEGLIQRVNKSIKKMSQALLEFIEKIVTKIKVTFCSKKTKETIDKMENASKTNPKLKNAKIKMYNVDQEQKCIQEAIDKLNAHEAKLKAGHTSSTDDDEIDAIKENCQKKRKAIIAATGVSLGVVGLIALYKKYSKKLDDGDVIKEAKEIAKDNELSDAVNDDETLRKISKIMTNKMILAREKVSSLFTAVNTMFGKLKGQVVAENLETESAESETYNNLMSTEIFGESSDNIDDVFNAIESAISIKSDIDSIGDVTLEDIEDEVYHTESTDNSDNEQIFESIEDIVHELYT